MLHKKLGWIIYYREAAEYNKGYIQFHMEEGEKLGIEFRLLLVEDMEFGIKDGEYYIHIDGEKVEKPDFAVVRAIYPLLSKHLEFMGIPTFNSSLVSEICNDKARTYQLIAQAKIPMIESVFCQNHRLKEILSQRSIPTIIKAVNGHGGTQVFLYRPGVDGIDKIDRIYEGMKGADVVIQPFIGSKNQDLRVYVLGNEIVGAVLRTAKEGFKSNYSLGGDIRFYHLSPEEKKIVYRIMEQLNADYVGIDFLIGDQGELIFNEIEDVVGSRMLYQCSDINIVEKYLHYIIDKINYKISKQVL